jgi:hypothetical protein
VPPLPNSRVFPRNWEAHHYPAANGQMTAECVITRPSTAGRTFDTLSGTSAYPEPDAVYTGACRVQHPTIQDMPAGPVERQTVVAEYTVTVPVDTIRIQLGDTVTITACDGDPDLVGEVLTVTGVPRGSLRFVQPITCKLQPATTR